MTNKYNFAFKLPEYNEDPTNAKKNEYFTYLQEHYPELRIVGLDPAEYIELDQKKQGIGWARPGSVIEFNRGEKYDVDWFGNEAWFFNATGATTELNLLDDWDEIMYLTDEYVKGNYYVSYNYYSHGRPSVGIPKTTEFTIRKGTTDVQIFDAFVAVDDGFGPTTIIPRYFPLKKGKKVRFDATQRAYAKDIIHEIIVTV